MLFLEHIVLCYDSIKLINYLRQIFYSFIDISKFSSYFYWEKKSVSFFPPLLNNGVVSCPETIESKHLELYTVAASYIWLWVSLNLDMLQT